MDLSIYGKHVNTGIKNFTSLEEAILQGWRQYDFDRQTNTYLLRQFNGVSWAFALATVPKEEIGI